MNYHFFRLKCSLSAAVFCLVSLHLPAQTPATLPDSLPHPDSLSEKELFDLALQFSNQAKVFEANFSQKNRAATTAREAAEQFWKNAKQDTLTSKTTFDSLANILKTAKNVEKTAQKQEKQAAQTTAFTNKVVGMDPANQRKNIRKAYRQLKELDEWLNPPPPPAEKPIAEILAMPYPAADSSAAVAEKRKKNDKKTEKTVPKHKPYDPAADVMLNPPQPPCSLAVNTRDEFSGETYRETARAEIFRYTNDVMKKILPSDQPHILCQAALSSGGGTQSLHLNFQIRDASARKSFGSLTKNSIAVLKFIDGTTLTVNNIRNDDGSLDTSGQAFAYHAQYALDAATLKKIRKSELDKIRIAWSTGYEDYDVQNIDLLMRLTKCLSE